MTSARAALNNPTATDPLGIAKAALDAAKLASTNDKTLTDAQTALNNARNNLSTGISNYAALQTAVSDAQAALNAQNTIVAQKGPTIAQL